LVFIAVAAAVAAPAGPASAAPPVANGAYVIVNVNSGKCLTTVAREDLGASHFQARCRGPWELDVLLQRWTLQNLDGGAAYRVSGLFTGRCMAIGSSATHDGAWAIQWTCLPIADQTWRLVPSGAGYAIVNANSNKCLAIGSGATHDGAVAIQWSCFGSREQQWVLQPV
jgi:hypothetical protein